MMLSQIEEKFKSRAKQRRTCPLGGRAWTAESAFFSAKKPQKTGWAPLLRFSF